MSSTRIAESTNVLRPKELATLLDLWALRREKVLQLLDLKAARAARKLARTCRLLAKATYADQIGEQSWRYEWRRVRELVLVTLTQARASMPARPSDQPVSSDTLSHSVYEPGETEQDTPTRSVDWSAEAQLSEGDRPTRVVTMSWLQAKVA